MLGARTSVRHVEAEMFLQCSPRTVNQWFNLRTLGPGLLLPFRSFAVRVYVERKERRNERNGEGSARSGVALAGGV
jgi:hypothetical protein